MVTHTQLFAVLLQTSRTIAVGVLLAGMSFAEQTSQDDVHPAVHVQAELVVVPFQVRRGSRSVSDLKPSDVVLLEDGAPRVLLRASKLLQTIPLWACGYVRR